MSKFKKGDKVCTPTNSHFNDKAYTVLRVDSCGVWLKGVPKHTGTTIERCFQEHELEFWDVYKSPLWEALR